MKRIIGIFVFLCVWYSSSVRAENTLQIVSWNVENLFYPEKDSINTDEEWTPEGTRHWGWNKYYNKINKISQVITSIGGWNKPAIIGLCEVESNECVRDLCKKINNYHYNYIHYDSKERRGIDVALLYDSTQFKPIQNKTIPIQLDSISYSRDILYSCGIISNGDTIHVFMCHFPSQLGGKKESQWKRNIANQVLQQQIDSLHIYNDAIIVMGDFNDNNNPAPEHMEDCFANIKSNIGTHKHQGIWNNLDKFYISPMLKEKASAHIYDAPWLLTEDKKHLGYQPKRTYTGYKYNKDGYSDHLPIYLILTYD